MMLCLKKIKNSKIIWLFRLGCLLVVLGMLQLLAQTASKFPIQTYLNQPLPFNRGIDMIRYFNRRGFDLPEMPPKTALWTQNIQLCIMFNTVFDDRTIGILLSYYLHFFNHITLISGTEIVTKPHFVPDSVQVLNCDSYYGWYQQKCLRSCMENPASDSVEGFLYIADDMFINITKMGQLNRNKLWTISIEIYNYTYLMQASRAELHRKWWWFGFPKYMEYYFQKTIENLPKEWVEALKINAGFPDRYEMVSTSDIYYIPASIAPNMIEVITFIVNTTNLFSEVATPLVVGIVTHPSVREVFSYGYLWGINRTLHKKVAIAEMAHFIHPLKLSRIEDFQLWTRLMNTQLMQLGNSEKKV